MFMEGLVTAKLLLHDEDNDERGLLTDHYTIT